MARPISSRSAATAVVGELGDQVGGGVGLHACDQVGDLPRVPPGARAGWPVVIAGHSFRSNKVGSDVRPFVAKLAQHGLAMIAINAVGHGRGPLGTLTVTKTDASKITLPAGGRGVDRNGDGTIGPDEDFFTAANGPQSIVLLHDGLRHTVIDWMQLVRELQVGIDVDGDSAPDLDAFRVYYLGLSAGGVMGPELVALEPSVRAGAFAP